jgi:hypothetical protein
MLILLLATCETALERFGGADDQVDARLLRDLARVIERARAELNALDE